MNWSEPVILIEYQYSVAEEVFIMSLDGVYLGSIKIVFGLFEFGRGGSSEIVFFLCGLE